MRLTATGWTRDCGATELFDIDLTDVRTGGNEATFGKNKPLLNIEINPHPSASGQVRSVALNCVVNLRLGGDYKLKLGLSKSEIARLFFLTHKREITSLTNLFHEEDTGEAT